MKNSYNFVQRRAFNTGTSVPESDVLELKPDLKPKNRGILFANYNISRRNPVIARINLVKWRFV